MAATGLELHDIQGNVLRGYGLPVAAYVRIQVDDPGHGRRLLRMLVREVTTAESWPSGTPPPSTLNVAISATGLCALAVEDAVVATFAAEFRQGMAARAERWLGDGGPSHPSRWERAWRDRSTHLLLTVNAVGNVVLEERLADLRRCIGSLRGLRVAEPQRAAMLPAMPDYGREHFGYNDGFAQPAVEGTPGEVRPGDGIRRHGTWRPVKAGEFLLGYPDEDDGVPDSPLAPLGRNGTFMVYRKLYQDVARFRDVIADVGRAHFNGDAELAAAKIVGRWRDGTPIVRSPERSDPELGADKNRTNNFDFSRDRKGERCPLGAHIRRANPRNTLPGGFNRSRRHRIIRRGMPYGPILPVGAGDDCADRGLIFVCFNASIVRQFETVNGWLIDGNPFGLGQDRDYLVGANERTLGMMTIQGRPPTYLSPQWPLVITRGGEYLFLPGITALHALGAECATAEPGA